MVRSASSPSIPSERYVKAAVSLAESLARNQSDEEFASEPGNEIVYVFDTNVFIYHIDLEDRYRLTHNVKSLIGDRATTSQMQTIERLTVEFLFSGQLPGQRERAGYITVPHFEEVLFRADAISARLSRELGTHERPGYSIELQSEFDEIASLLRQDLSPVKKFDRLARKAPRTWFHTLNATVHFERTLKEAFLSEPGLLIPLDRTNWGIAASRTRVSDVSEWKKYLPRPSASRPASLIQNDAEALQAVLNLNQLFATDEEGRTTKRYVLVSSDDAIVRAVTKRAKREGWDPGLVFARSTEDYLPLLNLKGMTVAFTNAGGNGDITRDFENVFNSLKAAVEYVGLASPAELGRINKGEEETPLHALQRDWAKASRYTSLLGIRYSAGQAEGLFAEVAQFIDSGRTKHLAAKSVQTTVDDVRDRHLTVVLESAIASVRSVRQAGALLSSRRVDILLLGDLLNPLLAGRPNLSAFLDDAIAKGSLPGETHQFVNRHARSPEVLLLATCLFVAAERWEPAAQFATKAFRLLRQRKQKSSPELREGAYLKALSLRFSMRTKNDFETARSLLEQNQQAYFRGTDRSLKTFVAQIRDDMELGNLLMTAALQQAFSKLSASRSDAMFRGEGPLQDEQISHVFARGVRRLREARERLGDFEVDDDVGDSAIDVAVTALTVMATTNLVGAFLFERIVPGLTGPRMAPVIEIDQLLLELERQIESVQRANKKVRPTQYIYFWCATLLRTPILSVKDEAIGKLESELAAFRKASDRATEADVSEFRWITLFVAREKERLLPVP